MLKTSLSLSLSSDIGILAAVTTMLSAAQVVVPNRKQVQKIRVLISEVKK
jgi:hypothetical protein